MAAGAVSLIKSHDIVISSFCNIVKGQANYHDERFANDKLFTWQQNATESIHLPL